MRGNSSRRSRPQTADDLTEDEAARSVEGSGRGGGLSVRRTVDLTVGAGLFACVLLAAIPLGANREWAWAPIAVVVGILAILSSLGMGSSEGHRLRSDEWPLLALMVASFAVVAAVGVLQTWHGVPPSWRAAVYARASEALGHDIAGVPSLSADVTWDTLMRIGATGAIFLMARAVCRDRRWAHLLLMLLVASAVLVTTYGLVMHATNGSCYVFAYNKRSELTPAGRLFVCVLSGTFVSSNSFATYSGMALVAALGLVFGHSPRKQGASFGDAWATGPRIACLAAAFYLLGGLLLSASRAGFASTVLGAIVLGLLLLRGRWPSRAVIGWGLVGAILVGAVLALLVGAAFFHKAASLSDGDISGRLRIWQIALEAIQQSPWLGWGLGTFADVYLMFLPSDLHVINDKAHSTPLEWMVDLGIPAALFAFALVLVPLLVCLRGARRRRTDRYLPITAFAVTLVAVAHSVVDFSLQMPAIAFVTAALLGMGWAQSFRRYE